MHPNVEFSPLHLAAKHSLPTTFSALLERMPFEVNCKIGRHFLHAGESIVHSACRGKAVPVVRLLVADSNLELGALNARRQSALHIACENWSAEIVELLIKPGKFNVNTEDVHGNRPIHKALAMKGIGEGGFSEVDRIVELMVKKSWNGSRC